MIIATPEGAGIEGMSLWGSECHAYGSLACYRGMAAQWQHTSLSATARELACVSPFRLLCRWLLWGTPKRLLAVAYSPSVACT